MDHMYKMDNLLIYHESIADQSPYAKHGGQLMDDYDNRF